MGRLWTTILILLLVMAVVAGAGLVGCRGRGDDATGGNGAGGVGSGSGGSGTPGDPGGSGGSGGSGASGDRPPLEITVYDDRLAQATGDTPFSGVEPYLETGVEPGDAVQVGQGAVTVTLRWAQRVKLADIQPFLALDPAPVSEWNWIEEWGDGSILQFRYLPDEAAAGVSIVLAVGLPLSDSTALETDYAFTLTRVAEPVVTMTVAGLPWVRSPYERPFTGYSVPLWRQAVTLEFSHAPDRVSVEERLGLRAAAGGRWLSYLGRPLEAKATWSGDRTLNLVIDLAEGERVILDVNGSAVPGYIPLARQSPLVLEGRSVKALAAFRQPADVESGVITTSLPLPLEGGRLSPDGAWAILWEHAPFVFPGEDTPDARLVPWLVRLADSQAVCLDGLVSLNWVHRCGNSGGWTADGRYVVPEHSRLVAVTPSAGEVGTTVLDGPTPDGNWKYFSYSVAPDGGLLAWLELARDAEGRHSQGMTLVVLDLATGQRRVYPDAAPVRLYDGVYYETPPITWLPLGQVGLWRDAPAGQSGRVLMALDDGTGRFGAVEFMAPDDKVLAEPEFWTTHPSAEEWRASGVAVGVERAADGALRRVMVTSAGRFALELAGGLGAAAPSPDGRWLAVEAVEGGEVVLIDRSSGATVRSFAGTLLGWAPDGTLWLMVEP